ncbi:MAG TPA: acyl-CoA dehydrogenase family protein [Candidatus Limnocylindria bacterium]|nr:acyl-CoA dehydrogenase family protein [Candidatus Limnocylindria bacterium]
MRTGNYFTGNADLVLAFDRLIPWDRVVPLVEGPGANVADTVSTWREILSVAGKYIGTDVAARAARIDELGVIRDGGRVEMSEPMRADLAGLRDLGLMGAAIPAEHGGAGLPFTVNAILLEMLARADLATQVQHGIGYTAPAALIARFGTEDQKKRYLPRLASGELMGAVAMTEPQAGSDVGNLSTTAVQEGDHWCLRGRKQFISAGTGEMVVVLARAVPGSTGLDGLALFIVDRANDNYQVERAEHKFTIRGSPTCALVFEGSRAEIMGAPGDGWRGILTFMNESRVGVGIQGIGVMQAAFDAASDYASRRVQMARPIREHPMVAEMLLDMETTIAGARALALEAAVLQDRVLFGRDERAGWDLRELTPLVKWYGSEQAVRVTRNALQVHGGYGVVTEYDVERFFRDSVITTIYEGTSQIQSLMAVRDLMRAVGRRPASLLRGGPSAMLARASFDGALGRDLAAGRGALAGALRRLVGGLVRRKGLGALGARDLSEEDLRPYLLHAERITATLAHLHVARALGEQAKIVPERRALAERAARRARLVAQANAREIASGDGGVFERIDAWTKERG